MSKKILDVQGVNKSFGGLKALNEVVFDAVEWIKENMPDVDRFVTLSPPTEMAERFHIKNGAIKLRVNEETVNFEYEDV